MEIVKDAPASDPVKSVPANAVSPLEALRSLWPAIVQQVEDEMKAGRFKVLAEAKVALEALDQIRDGAKALLGMVEQHKQNAAMPAAPDKG